MPYHLIYYHLSLTIKTAGAENGVTHFPVPAGVLCRPEGRKVFTCSSA